MERTARFVEKRAAPTVWFYAPRSDQAAVVDDSKPLKRCAPTPSRSYSSGEGLIGHRRSAYSFSCFHSFRDLVIGVASGLLTVDYRVDFRKGSAFPTTSVEKVRSEKMGAVPLLERRGLSADRRQSRLRMTSLPFPLSRGPAPPVEVGDALPECCRKLPGYWSLQWWRRRGPARNRTGYHGR